MFKYRSKCKWNQLLSINNNVIEIRPGEFFESSHELDSPFIELIVEKKIIFEQKKKKVLEDDHPNNSQTKNNGLR
jgi:hypothetical protein